MDAALEGDSYYSLDVQKLMNEQQPQAIDLTPRQMAILHFIAEGESNKEIGYRLRIAAPTVSFHLREIREKLDVPSNKKIIEKARELKLV